MNYEFREEELHETFSGSSGPGGQNVNKVATRVTLVHKPTGLMVSVQDSRSQAMNRQLARERLQQLLIQRREDERQRRQSQIEKERRRKRPRPRGLKERILQSKKHRSKIKQNRSGRNDI